LKGNGRTEDCGMRQTTSRRKTSSEKKSLNEHRTTTHKISEKKDLAVKTNKTKLN